MKSRIYYFTGTGNSLYIARELAKGIKGCDTKSITQSMDDEYNFDTVGVVCPNYSYDVPHLVGTFLERLKKIGNYNYLFVTLSAGGDFGYISKKVQRRLKGARLKSIFQHYMPFNFLPFGDVTTPDKQKELFSKLEEELSVNLKIINSREEHIDNRVQPFSKYMQFFYNAAYPLIPQFDRIFTTTDKCNGCDVCQKVCPVNNIILKNDRPKWNHRCQQCYACVHWCPKEAILCGKKSKDKGRYHHPDVTIKEIMVT